LTASCLIAIHPAYPTEKKKRQLFKLQWSEDKSIKLIERDVKKCIMNRLVNLNSEREEGQGGDAT